jgi:hypothetical protein
MINTIVGSGAVGAGAASRYGSDQMMRLLVKLKENFHFRIFAKNFAKINFRLL